MGFLTFSSKLPVDDRLVVVKGEPPQNVVEIGIKATGIEQK